MQRNKSFDFREKFGVIYSASKTKEHLSTPLAIGFGFKNKQTLQLLAPEIQTGGSFKPQSNLFFEIPKQLNDF